MYVPLIVHPGCEEITEAYPTQKLGMDTIDYSVDYFTAILSACDENNVLHESLSTLYYI
jgi:hypothetical protein